jgi:hypothetical protein
MPANEQHNEENLNASGSGQDAFGVGDLAKPHWYLCLRMHNTMKKILMPQAPVKMRLALGLWPIHT